MEYPKLIIIDWIDVQSASVGLFHRDEIKDIKPSPASIVGWLVKEDKTNWYIAREFWWDTEQFKYLHVIPKNTAIIKEIELDIQVILSQLKKGKNFSMKKVHQTK